MMDRDAQILWRAHCFKMAEATYALADQCEQIEHLAALAAAGARWIVMAEQAPEIADRRRRSGC